MKKILLRIEIGDWDGGNNGRYPKLLEWNLEDEDYPIDESDGWGHGLGGGRTTISNFIRSNGFQELKKDSSNWVYETIKRSVELNLTVEEMGVALVEESKGHRVNIPEHLLVVLGRSASYVNGQNRQ